LQAVAPARELGRLSLTGLVALLLVFAEKDSMRFEWVASRESD